MSLISSVGHEDKGLHLLTRAKGQLPLEMNFGCGNTILEDAVNVDISLSETVVEANKDKWIYVGNWTDPHEFPVDHFETIMCYDVLEHIHPADIGNLLYCMNTCMQTGGTLEVIVPDFLQMAKDIRKLGKKMHLDKFDLDKMRLIELMWMAPYQHSAKGHQSIWTIPVAIERMSSEGFAFVGGGNRGGSQSYSMHLEFMKESTCQI